MTRLKFTQRPTPVLAEHRTLYKIAQILLVLDICGRGRRSSVLKLHLFNWAMKSESRLKQLQLASRKGGLDLPIWGFDPALGVALKFAIEEQLIVGDSTAIEVSDAGIEFLNFIVKDKELLMREKVALRLIGKGVTEKMVESIAKGWSLQ